MSLTLAYTLEAVAILLTWITSVLAGYCLTERARGAGLLAFFSGISLITLLLAGHRLMPAIYRIPQPVAIAPNLILALGMCYLGVAIRIAWDRRLVRVLVLGQILVAAYLLLASPVALILVGPRYAALAGRPAEAHYRQSRPETCAASCCQTILRRCGVAVTEGEMAVRLRTTPIGSRFYRIIPALREAAAARAVPLDCTVRFDASRSSIAAVSAPAILVVRNHVLVLLEQEDGRLWIADPARQRTRRMTPEAFGAAYRWTGTSISVRRSR